MPCLLLLVMLAFPRLALAFLFFFTTYLDRAFHGLLIPLLGFLFLPLTTLVYTWMVYAHHPAEGVYLVALVVSALADLGLLGGSQMSRRN